MQTITLPTVTVPEQIVETAHGKLIYPGLDIPSRMLVVDTAEIQALIKAARNAADHAYSAYQVQFPVGAALIMRDDPDGQIFASGNSENSVLNAGVCAERAALSYAAGQGFRLIKAIAVSTAHRHESDVTLRSPCGLCRQAIREFANDDTVIAIDYDSPGVLANIFDINRVLPYGYHYTPVAH
jgi:cytidine deaminase